MLSEEDLISRIVNVRNLNENCFKYLEESSKNLLTHQIIYAVATLVSKKMEPIKLSEIAQIITGISDKAKQDNIRLTIEKSLLKCGIVEKLHYAANDVRYILTGYRFQKIKPIDSFRGDRIEPVGQIFELPKKSWPIPDEFFILLSKKYGYDEALRKINSDFDKGMISRGKYEDLVREYSEKLTQIRDKLRSKFNSLEDLVASQS